MELATIKKSGSISQIGVIASFLESEGIETFVKDEHMGQMYAGAVDLFAIKLQVREEDCQRAIDLLVEAGFAQAQDYELDKSQLLLTKWVEKIKRFFGF